MDGLTLPDIHGGRTAASVGPSVGTTAGPTKLQQLGGKPSVQAAAPHSNTNGNNGYVYSNSRVSTLANNNRSGGVVGNHGGSAATDPDVEGTTVRATASPTEEPSSGQQGDAQQQQRAFYDRKAAAAPSTAKGGNVFNRLAMPNSTMKRALAAAGLAPKDSAMGASDAAKASSARGLSRPTQFGPSTPQAPPAKGPTSHYARPAAMSNTYSSARTPSSSSKGAAAAPGVGIRIPTLQQGAPQLGNNTNKAGTSPRGAEEAHRHVATAPLNAVRPKQQGSKGSVFGGGPMTAAGPAKPIQTAQAAAIPNPTPVTNDSLEGTASVTRHTNMTPSGTPRRDPFASSKGSRPASRSSSQPADMGDAVASTNTRAVVSLPIPPKQQRRKEGTTIATKMSTITQTPPARVPQTKFFQNYHVMLQATKAENEAAKLEGRGASKLGTLEGALQQERALWIRSNYAVLNKGVLPIQNALPTASAPSSPGAGALALSSRTSPLRGGGPRLSITEPAPLATSADANNAQWEKSEVLVVVCNQMLVRHLQSLSDDHVTLANELVGVCERLLWTPLQLLLTHGPAAESSTLTPQLLAMGPMAGSDPFVGYGALKSYLLGCTLTNYAAVQRLSREPLENVVATLERALQIQELQFSCQTLFNLAAVLVEAHRFSDAFEAAQLCVELANHYLSCPFMAREQQSPAYEAFINETATVAVLAHHLMTTVATWSGSDDVAAYHAQLALGCATTFLGHAHAITTRSAQRLEAVASGTAGILSDQLPEGATGVITIADENPPLIPTQMAVFGSNVRPSAILSYAMCYPLSSQLQRRLHELRGTTPDGKKLLSPRRFKGGKALKVDAQAAFAKHFSNVLHERRTGLPAISTASVAGSPTPAYLAMMRARGLAELEASAPVGGLRFIKPAAPGTVLMPPLTPAYRSVGNYGSPTRQQNTMLVAQVDGKPYSNGATPLGSPSLRAMTPNGNFAPLSIEDRRRSPSTSPTSKQLLALPGSPTARPDDTLSTSSRICANLTGFGVGTGGPSPRFQSTRPRSSNTQDRDGVQVMVADDGTLLPGFTLEKPRGSIILADRHILVPQPPAPRTDKCVSVIPLRDYEMYQTLQADVEGYLEPQYYASNGRGGSPKSRAAWLRGSIVGTTAPRSHSHAILKKSDEELRALSEVIPDHTPEDEARWHAAARTLQLFYRIIEAKRERNRRAFYASQWRELCMYGEVISQAYRNYKERRPAIEEKHRRARHAACVRASIVVQSLLRAWQSTEVAAGKMLRSLEAQRVVESEQRMREMSARLIQAVYRGHLARTVMSNKVKAAKSIQRLVRLFAAYKHVRLLVYRKRDRVRAENAMYNKNAQRIQRWWRHLLLGIHAVRELQRRKELHRLYMEDYLVKDKQYWDLFRNVNEEECVATIGRVGRAYAARRTFGVWAARFIKETRAANVIQRFVRYGIAKNILNNRRRQKDAVRAAKRADEERRVAATDIQSIARMYMAKQRCDRIRAHNALRLRSAIIIQNLFRRAIRRKTFHALKDANDWDRMLYMRAEARRYAATKIQSIWRMHRARQFTEQYGHFKLVVEPNCANIVQRAVRCFLARAHYRARLVEVSSLRRVAQLQERQRSAAVQIQSTWRMYKVTSDPTFGRHTHPTFVASKAATRIQTLWRMVAAKCLVRQLMLARQHRDQYYVNLENLHMYAIKIQSVVRMAILNRKWVRLGQLIREESAARRIQECGRRFMKKRTDYYEAKEASARAWEAAKAAETAEAQRAAEALLATKQAEEAYAKRLEAGRIIVLWAKCCLARKYLREARAARDAILEHTLLGERNEAASTIQRWWLALAAAGKVGGAAH